jgi:hypothetical protein
MLTYCLFCLFQKLFIACHNNLLKILKHESVAVPQISLFRIIKPFIKQFVLLYCVMVNLPNCRRKRHYAMTYGQSIRAAVLYGILHLSLHTSTSM